MSRMEWSRERNIWIKECTLCKHEYKITADTWSNAYNLFRLYFYRSSPHYDELKPHCIKCDITRSKRSHRDYIIRTYGIDFAYTMKMQNNKCAICNTEMVPKAKDNRVNACVDHCHKTGKARGILCASCNTGLGHFKDDIEVMKRAIEYLTMYATTMEISDAQRILQEESAEQDED